MIFKFNSFSTDKRINIIFWDNGIDGDFMRKVGDHF